MTLDLYEFETTEAAVVDGGGEAGAAPSPTGEAALPPAAATEAAPAWSPDDPAFRDAVAQETDALVQARLHEFMQTIQQNTGGQPQPQPQQLPDFDPFDPASVQAYYQARDQQLLHQIDQRLQQVTQPFAEQQDAARLAHGDELAKDMIADDIARNGDVTDSGKEAIEPLANMFVNDFASRYGVGPRAAEMAIQKAAGLIRGIEKAAADKALAAHVNRNQQLAGVHGEPGAGGGSGVVTPPDRPKSPRELAMQYGRNAAALRQQ